MYFKSVLRSFNDVIMTSQVRVWFCWNLSKTKFFQMDFSALNFAPSSKIRSSTMKDNRLSFRMHYRKSWLSHSFTEKIALLYGRFFRENFRISQNLQHLMWDIGNIWNLEKLQYCRKWVLMWRRLGGLLMVIVYDVIVTS